ncbi:MAG: anti-sigma F factor [Oscillospiraceae bacterium]|nr:anti-sigma F factor [Oscillospiraceae bacterium]
MKAINTARISFQSRSSNEVFARAAVSGFITGLDPTLEELTDVKTAVSEAVTNCIVHAYPGTLGMVNMTLTVYPDRRLVVRITDKGCGIPDVKKAMEPLYTTGNKDERSGLGFAVMQSFMDKVKVVSTAGGGTKVTLTKLLRAREEERT